MRLIVLRVMMFAAAATGAFGSAVAALTLRTRRMVIGCVMATALGPVAMAADHWYSVEMFGGTVGTMHAWQITTADEVLSASDMKFEIKRGPASVKVSMKGEYVESAKGKPIRMKSVQTLGATPLTQEWTFGEKDVTVTTTQGEQITKSTVALPTGEWLSPTAAEKYVTQRLKSGATEIVTRSIDPSNGLTPLTATRVVIGKETIAVGGRDLEVFKCKTRVSSMPGIESLEYYDTEGLMVKGTTQMGGIEVVITLSDAIKAKAGLDAGAQIAPDMLTGTFVKPDKRIDNPRGLSKGVYVLSVDEGALETVPATGSQRFERESSSRGLVTVTTDPKLFAPASPLDVTDAAYLASTAMCSTSDEAIKRLAARAVRKLSEKELADPAVVAGACREFVYRYISKKSLGVGYASATEIARTREGDCSEHAVLLCALLRVHNIPARVACGLIYADAFAGSEHIFGYHMWSQALLPGEGGPRWVDLDATLPVGIAYDATHICLGTSTLADGDATQSMIGVATNMGRLKITVKEP